MALANQPNLPPTWMGLIAGIYALEAAGPDGFEGFCATLLKAVTHRSFIVSAGGSQPTADAVDPSGATCLQAKRYRFTTTLNLNDIVGNIYTAQAAAPELEVYVVALTRDAAQLRQRVAEVELNTGLDVVVLDASDGLSPLGALVVSHWSAVRHCLSSFGPDWDTWVAVNVTEPATQSVAQSATADIAEGLRTQAWLRERAAEVLAVHFRPTAPTGAFEAGQRINLAEAVERTRARQQLADWWNQVQQPNGMVEAEEGFGKTWAVAAFALAQAQGGVPVLWLESSRWSGCRTLEAIIREALRAIIPEGDRRLERFVRKALRLWTHPLLIVLDGVNEYDCLDAAQRVLSLYGDHATHYAAHVRFLFTTRPLKLRPAWELRTWARCRAVPVTEFDDLELTAALQLQRPAIPLAAIPANVLPLARVPRYFSLCLKLRSRLRSLGQVTKPLLLFVDLLDKIENADQGVRHLYGNRRQEAEAILAHLAQQAQSHLPTGWKMDKHHVDVCFPQLGPKLVELAEGKVLVEQRPDTVVVNDEHVVLGFALHLLQVGENSLATEGERLADEIARELEPNREQDLRAEALYLALLLTCLRPPGAAQSTERLRTALLVLWWNQHNALHDHDRLRFWSDEDVRAYAAAIESVFRWFYSATTEAALITPLARLWRDDIGSRVHLTQILERWLALVYPPAFAGDTAEEKVERQLFPPARSSPQLRLSAVAISILSLRPEEQMLSALARGARSMHFCIEEYLIEGKQKHRTTLKDLYEVLSILACWGYGEKVVAHLQALAEQTADPGLLDGLRTLARSTQLVELPSVLRIELNPRIFAWPDRSPAAVFAGFRQWLGRLPFSDPTWPNHVGLGPLAVRTDLPALTSDEVDRLFQFLLTPDGIADSDPKSDHNEPRSYVYLLPWLARSDPERLPAAYAACLRQLLASENPEVIIVVPSVLLTSALAAELVDTIASNESLSRKVQGADGFGLRLTTAVLLAGDDDTRLRWFDYICRYPGLQHAAWEFLPAAWVLQKVATDQFRAAVRARYDAEASAPGRGSTPARAELYWLNALATCRGLPPDVVQSANRLLLDLESSDPRTEYFLRIVAGSEDADVLEGFLNNERLKRHLREPRLAQVFGAFLRQPPDRRLRITFREVQGQLPLQLARGFLLMASTDDDLVDYAEAVAATALQRVAQPSARPPVGFVSEFSVDEVGDIVSWGLDRDIGQNSQAMHCGGSALWGVDRGSTGDLAQMLNAKRDPKALIAPLNAELKVQNERHQSLPDGFVVQFHGAHALELWAQRRAPQYSEYCDRFFTYLRSDRGHLFDVGAFAYALLRPLCTLDLRLACRLHEEFFTHDVVRIYRMGLLDAFTAELWRKELDRLPEIAAVRQETILACRNDLELLWVVIAAHRGGTVVTLESLTATWLNSDWGKERALAVTVLGFTADGKWENRLRAINSNDPSRWVRGQASWAVELLRQSLSIRALWDEVCTQSVAAPTDLTLLSSRMVRLEDTLPPMAHGWPRPQWEGCDASTANALMIEFWQGWASSSQGKGEANFCDRRLKDYCRGIQLRQDHATRLAPWWNPE